MPYKPAGAKAGLSHGSKNDSTNKKSRKPPKITPAMVMSGMPATFICAMGEASKSSFFLYGRTMAAMAVPKDMMAMPCVVASVIEVKPPTLQAYKTETSMAVTTINRIVLKNVALEPHFSVFFRKKRPKTRAKIHLDAKMEKRQKVKVTDEKKKRIRQ